jgi:hypothetical protein
LGDTLKVCFLEAVLRDRRDGLVGDLPIEEKEIYTRRYAEIETIEVSALSISERTTRSEWECRRMSRNLPAKPLRGHGRLPSMSTDQCRTDHLSIPPEWTYKSRDL